MHSAAAATEIGVVPSSRQSPVAFEALRVVAGSSLSVSACVPHWHPLIAEMRERNYFLGIEQQPNFKFAIWF